MFSFTQYRNLLAATALGFASLCTYTLAYGQAPGVQMCKPIGERTAELGCWILADQPIGPLTKTQVFWHLDNYPSQEAATKAKGPRGTVVNALGKVWLLTIEESVWQAPAGAEHVSTVGPLPIGEAEQYSTQYMELLRGRHSRPTEAAGWEFASPEMSTEETCKLDC